MDHYDVLWDRLAGGINLYVENYILSLNMNKTDRFRLQPSYPVDYKIENLERIITAKSPDDYFSLKISGCRDINDLSVELKELVSQYLPRFFSEYPMYKDEKCLKIDN